MFINAGRQGASLPTHENRRHESGVTHELGVLAMEAVIDGRLKATLTMGNPKQGGKKNEVEVEIRPEDIKRVVPSYVYWTSDQCDTKYKGSQYGRIIDEKGLFTTALEYWETVMGVTPHASNQLLPVFAYQWLIYEQGMTGASGETKVWKEEAPKHYVPFKNKLAFLRGIAGWVEPEGWKDGFPGVRRQRLLLRYPPAVPAWGKRSSVCPAGSAYYPIVRLELKPDSEIHKVYQIAEVIPCVEQLIGDRWEPDVEAWPAATFSIESRFDPEAGPLDENGSQSEEERKRLEAIYERNGVWRNVEEELHESLIFTGGYEAEDFGSEVYVEEQPEDEVYLEDEESEETEPDAVTETESEEEADYGEAESVRG